MRGQKCRFMASLNMEKVPLISAWLATIAAPVAMMMAKNSMLWGMMEKNGFINRTSVFNDARLKKLVLTEKAKAIADDHREKVEWFEGMLKKGFTDEEISTLFTLLDKLLENLDETEVNNK